jgi:hypothetical protein
MKYSSNSYEEKGARAAFYNQLSADCVEEGDKEGLEYFLQYFYVHHLVKHHPLSRQYLDFSYRKLILLVLHVVVSVIYWRRKLASSDQVTPFGNTMDHDILRGIWSIFMLVWVGSIVKAFLSSSNELKKTKYLKCRHRQILFRFIRWLVSILNFFFVVLFCSRLAYSHRLLEHLRFRC